MKQLRKFILWLIGLGLICIIGISNVFGATTKTIYSGLDSSGNLTGSNIYNYGFMNQGGVIVPSTASVGNTIQGVSYAFTFYFYENTLLTNTYTLKIYFKADDLKSNFSSNMVDIKTCTATSCNNAVVVSLEKSNPTGYSTNITIKFNPVVIGSIIQVNLNGGNNAITGVSTFGISSVTIDSENQNQDIMNNANQNANNIIANQNSSASSIIENQNQNAEDIQNTIREQFKNCENKTITNPSGMKNSALNSSGVIESADNFEVSDIIQLEPTETYTLTKNGTWGSGRAYCLYKENGTVDHCYSYLQQTTFTITGAYAIRFTWGTTSSREVSLSGLLCYSVLEEQEKTSKGILGKLTELITNLFDTSGPDTSDLENMVGWLPPGPVDSILNLPLILYNSYLNALTGTCEPLHIKIPYLNDKYIDIPCISTIFSDINGLPSFWTWVGVITSVVILYRYLISLYQYYDKLTTLQANFYDDFGGAP